MIRLDAATFMLQWAVGGLFFTWITTRRREVGLGYGWLMRGLFGAMALGAVGLGQVIGPVPVRDVAAVGVAIAAPTLALAVFFAGRPDFAPPALREEALLVVLLLGLGIAIAPGVAAGWQSAAVLNLQPEQEQVASQAVPAWALLVTGGAAALGGLYTVWIRR